MEAPRQIKPKGPADYLEILTKAVFQSGISWKVIEAKWEGFREAFSGFEVETVANLTPQDVDGLAEDTRIVRNRRKIEATVENAETLLALDREHRGFKRYLKSHEGFDETAADLISRFKFLGATGAYYFLYVVGEPVPPHEEWMAAHPSTARRPTARGR